MYNGGWGGGDVCQTAPDPNKLHQNGYCQWFNYKKSYAGVYVNLVIDLDFGLNYLLMGPQSWMNTGFKQLGICLFVCKVYSVSPIHT